MIKIYSTVIELVAKILKIPVYELDINSRIDETQNWDSLTNMDVLLEVEKYFSIQFKITELENLDSIRKICENLEIKLN